MKRAIVLYPNFNDSSVIQMVRDKYDPLANYIAPHITIVFPFESDGTSTDLKLHLQKMLEDKQCFRVQLNGITGDNDGYLFLNVKKGNDQIIELHDKLYTGILEGYFNRHLTFFPHLTVGKLNNQSELEKAVDEFKRLEESYEAIIDRVYVVSIDNREKAITEFAFELK